MVLYTLLALYVLIQFYKYQFDLNLQGGYQMYFSAIVVTIIISLFMHGRSFLFHWKETAVRAERFQKESMKSKYESLKNQVNPHFLFNSLNALTNLVYEDRDQAAKFIKQLSQVYRYVLDTRDQEVVAKDDELEFLNSYLFLQQIRFENNLQVKIELQDVETHFPPLVLQMLIENAIKHNVVSTESPLVVQIYGDNGFVIVENSLKKKTVMKDESPGVGLENIKMRYEFLSSHKVLVEQNGQSFMVKLPVIKLTEK
jgi:LytS/YehU family sensor histidine kinase